MKGYLLSREAYVWGASRSYESMGLAFYLEAKCQGEFRMLWFVAELEGVSRCYRVGCARMRLG